MKSLILAIMSMASFKAYSQDLSILSSCEIDLNADKIVDTAFILQSSEKQELYIILRSKKQSKAFVLSEKVAGMSLQCLKGFSIKETKAGTRKGAIHKTPGAYIHLYQPESSSVAFYWDGENFKEIWTSD